MAGTPTGAHCGITGRTFLALLLLLADDMLAVVLDHLLQLFLTVVGPIGSTSWNPAINSIFNIPNLEDDGNGNI